MVLVEILRLFVERVSQQPVIAVRNVYFLFGLTSGQFIVLTEEATILLLLVGNTNLLRNGPTGSHVQFGSCPIINRSLLNEFETANNPAIALSIIVEHCGSVIS